MQTHRVKAENAKLKAEIDMAQGEIEHMLGGPRQTLMDAVQDWKAHCADAERDKLRNVITAAACLIRVAAQKAADAPMSASAHYEEVLGILADHAGEWSPECASLRDFTAVGQIAAKRDKLRQLIRDIDISDLLKHDLLLCDVDMGKPCACGLVQLQDRINKALGDDDGN